MLPTLLPHPPFIIEMLRLVTNLQLFNVSFDSEMNICTNEYVVFLVMFPMTSFVKYKIKML